MGEPVYVEMKLPEFSRRVFLRISPKSFHEAFKVDHRCPMVAHGNRQEQNDKLS